jgi:hypothetical protein
MFVRGLQLQKAKEFLEDNIALLEKGPHTFESTRLKYLCKLYEALGHLYCDPYIFDKAEEWITKAEDTYNKHTDLLPIELYRKFKLKKAAFLKKNGLFYKSTDLLKEIEHEIMEELKHNPKDRKELRKLLFKTYRDQARLVALRRQEKEAFELHDKAERILKEELYPGVEHNIKMAKLQMLKGLWSAKFDFSKATDELLEAYHMFEEVQGDDKTYYGANCQLEIGSNYLRLNEPQTATAFLYKANEILENLFGDSHPIIQKYYSYSSEVASHVDDIDTML